MIRFVLVLVLAASAGAVGWTALRLRSARSDAESANSRLTATRDIAQRVIELRARSERVSIGARPEQDTTARVLTAMTAAGLPHQAFRSLAPEADTPLARSGESGPAYHRQSFRLTLEPVDARQLGAFLAAWRAEQAAWTVERIELTHVASGQDRAADEDRYSARLTIAATYIAEDTKEKKP